MAAFWGDVHLCMYVKRHMIMQTHSRNQRGMRMGTNPFSFDGVVVRITQKIEFTLTDSSISNYVAGVPPVVGMRTVVLTRPIWRAFLYCYHIARLAFFYTIVDTDHLDQHLV